MDGTVARYLPGDVHLRDGTVIQLPRGWTSRHVGPSAAAIVTHVAGRCRMARGATKEQFPELSISVLRSLIREKVHHAVETAIELFALKGKPASPNLGHS